MSKILSEKFVSFVENEKLFSRNDMLLLGFSGGSDSVCLADLLIKNGFKLALVHINFQLRAEDSESDQKFSQKYAEQNNLKFHTTQFETKEFAEQNKYSIEEAARILRYREFKKIREAENYKYILTAHHSDDNAETFLINFISGTGIRGLSGIKPKNEKIIRPLLFASKDEIMQYCKNNELDYRIDKSNFEIQFVRNRIRQNIIPEFKKINPAFHKTANRNFAILKETEELFLDAVEKYKKEITEYKDENIQINISTLKKIISPKTILYELLNKYGFNYSDVKDIFESVDSEPGKLFYSEKYILLKDREYFILSNKNKFQKKEIDLSFGDFQSFSDLGMKCEIFSISEKNKIVYSPECAFLDFDKIRFPLKYRTVKNGDKFKPLGMQGEKLLSDYFTDKKYTYFQKKEAEVLCSCNEIIWIVGDRISDKYKITKSTQQILKICRVES